MFTLSRVSKHWPFPIAIGAALLSVSLAWGAAPTAGNIRSRTVKRNRPLPGQRVLTTERRYQGPKLVYHGARITQKEGAKERVTFAAARDMVTGDRMSWRDWDATPDTHITVARYLNAGRRSIFVRVGQATGYVPRISIVDTTYSPHVNTRQLPTLLQDARVNGKLHPRVGSALKWGGIPFQTP
jgi:hypothetical protein